MPQFVTHRRVEFVDTDMAGIMHFSRFFLLMESVETEFLRSLGLSVSWREQPGERLGLPRVSAQCDYLRPARFEDVIECRLSIERIGEKSISYTHEFWIGGELAAKGRLTACCIRANAEGMRGIPLPAEMRAALEKVVRA